MNLLNKVILTFSFTLLFSVSASEFKDSFNRLSIDGFTDTEIVKLYKITKIEGALTQHQLQHLRYAISIPYAPESSHTGNKFFEALAWYNDMTQGNKNGKYTLEELQHTFEKEAHKYYTLLTNEASTSDRTASWKMLQKLTYLRKEIVSSQRKYYRYRPKTLSTVNFNNEWNKKNTINSRSDFNKRVLQASWNRPVLIKFGLTYCIHCLLMENLGSVPAVASKYKGSLHVYKLWWNPKDHEKYGELNQIAQEQGITSSPMFNLYIDGNLVNSGYAFPDENGNGLESFLENYL